MNNWKYKMYQFMQGRYGMDQLGRFLLIAGVIAILLSNFRFLRMLYLLGLALLIWAYMRAMSRNIWKRQRENQFFLAFRQRFPSRKNGGSRQQYRAGQAGRAGQTGRTGWTDQNNGAGAADYVYYRCRNCGQTVRVPKGKGTLKITCPSCGNSFVDRT